MKAANYGVEELSAAESRQVSGGEITAVVVAVATLFIAAFGSGFKAGYDRGSQ